jgi:hypothetical protein
MDVGPQTMLAQPGPPPKDGRSAMAIAGAAIGIAILVSTCVPIIGWFIAAVAAIVLGAMGVRSDRRGLAITGIVTGSVFIVAMTLYLVLYGAALLLPLLAAIAGGLH